MSREWRVEGTIRDERLGAGVIISEGFNSRRDGPERYVAEVFQVEPKDVPLMIAAPDLLDALNGLSEWVLHHARYPDLCEPLKVARAAIAKATQP